MKKKLLFIVLPFIFSCTQNQVEIPIQYSESIIQQKNDIEVKLIKELTSSLDLALLEAQKSKTPEEAEKISEKVFSQELSKAFNKPIKQLVYQFQTQAQWTVNKTIQVQLQAQISDKNLTAQAQRQANFKPI